MFVLPCKQTTYFDVDDTLIMWKASSEQLDAYGVTIVQPISTVFNEDGEEVEIGGWTQRVLPHRKHIEQLKKHKLRGHTIIVWSQGGYDWAAAAVKALELENFVDLAISKPIWIYDDKKPVEFMPSPIWMSDEEDTV